MVIFWYAPGSTKEVTLIWLSFFCYTFKIMISVIRQFKTHGITTYVKEIMLQHSLCLYEYQSYSYSGTPRSTYNSIHPHS